MRVSWNPFFSYLADRLERWAALSTLILLRIRLPMRPHLPLSLLFTIVAVLSAALCRTDPAPAGGHCACAGPTVPARSRSPRYSAQSRPSIGVAFGGGSARGIAHVGVIRWLEEHRIPIDVAAGTSMGGLIGGSFATGMDADEIDAMLGGIDWDVMFGVVELRLQEHPPQGRRARLPVPARVRPEGRHRRPDLAQQRRAGRPAARADRRAVLRHRPLRPPADAVPGGGRRPGECHRSGDGSRVARPGDARDDVAAPRSSRRSSATGGCWSTAAR